MTSKEAILEFIRKNRRMLEDRYCVEKIAVFGSYARDKQPENSDIDLLVTLARNTPDIYEIKQGLRDLFSRQFNCDVDIASEKYLKPYVRDEILREAVYA
jgi:hypothetical protein